MPQTWESQNAFNAGELSPRILGRSSLPAYKAGLRLLENYLVLRPGGLERRPGTHYVLPIYDETKQSRLIPFRFSATEAYILEFAEGWMRVFTLDANGDGTVVNFATHTQVATLGWDLTTEEVLVPRHGYLDGQLITFDAGSGTLPSGVVDGAQYTVVKAPSFAITQEIANIDTTANTILVGTGHELLAEMGPFHVSSTDALCGGLTRDTDYYVESLVGTDKIKLSLTKGGSAESISSVGTGTLSITPTPGYLRDKFRIRAAGGTMVDLGTVGSGNTTVQPLVAEPFSVTFPYLESELFEIQYAQDKDVMYLTHGTSVMRKITRYAEHCWEIENVALTDGPYLDIQEQTPGVVDDAITWTIDNAAVGYERTITASKAMFLARDVGRHFRFGDPGDAAEWGWGKITGVGSVDSFTKDDFFQRRLTFVFDPFLGISYDGPLGDFYDNEGLYLWHLYSHGSAPGGVFHVVQANVYYVNYDVVSGSIGSMTLTPGASTPVSCLHDAEYVSARLNKPLHGLSGGEGPLTLSTTGMLPGGFSTTATYYIGVYDANSFYLTDAPGGDPIHPRFDITPGYGTHTINGLDSVPQVTCKAQVVVTLPGTSAGNAWKLGAFGSDTLLGWPAAVGLHEQRLVVGGALGTPQTVYGSVSGQQLTFSPDEEEIGGAFEYDRVLTTASGYTFRLVSEDLNAIAWLRPARALFAAGLGGIFHLTGATVTDALTPESVNARRGTTKGAATVSPVMSGSAVVFVDEATSRVQRAEFRPDIEAIRVDDLMQLSDHLSYGYTMVQLARTETPLPIVWGVRSDGELLSLTIDENQNIQAWARHPMGGSDVQIESCATLPDAQGGALWLVVRRTINGQTRRYIEYMADRVDEIADYELFQNGDSGPLPYSGSAITTITQGLSHLEGETVQIIADGAAHPDRVVTGGAITLDRAATKVVVGLAFPAKAQLLPPEMEQPGQHLAMRTVRSIEAAVRLERTRALKVGPSEAELVELEFRDRIDLMDEPPPIFSGIKDLAIPSGYERDGGLWLVSDAGTPCQILSVLQRIEVVQR